MADDRLQLAVIVGSMRSGRIGPAVAGWLMTMLSEHERICTGARAEWRAKPVGFVSYGGIAGGLRAVEQLRLVFAELRAVTVRQVVSLHWVHDLLDGNAELHDPGAPAAARAMVAQLCWWACALRKARAEGTYDV